MAHPDLIQNGFGWAWMGFSAHPSVQKPILPHPQRVWMGCEGSGDDLWLLTGECAADRPRPTAK